MSSSWRRTIQAKSRIGSSRECVAHQNHFVRYFFAHKGTAGKRVRDSAQPMSTAKALVKGWHGRRRVSAAEPPVDDRAALIRAAYTMELGHGWPAGDQAKAA